MALSTCNRCNSHKGTNLASVDPLTGDTVRLLHPQDDSWDEHFALVGAEILGRNATGRTTVELLPMNEEKRLELRQLLIESGEF